MSYKAPYSLVESLNPLLCNEIGQLVRHVPAVAICLLCFIPVMHHRRAPNPTVDRAVPQLARAVSTTETVNITVNPTVALTLLEAWHQRGDAFMSEHGWMNRLPVRPARFEHNPPGLKGFQ